MALYVVAVKITSYIDKRFYDAFRIIDTRANTVNDYPADDVWRWLSLSQDIINECDCPKPFPHYPIRIKNLELKLNNRLDPVFHFVDCDASWLCHLDDNGNPGVNADSLLVLAVDREKNTAQIANCKGQILTAPIKQVISNVLQRKYVLANARLIQTRNVSEGVLPRDCYDLRLFSEERERQQEHISR